MTAHQALNQDAVPRRYQDTPHQRSRRSRRLLGNAAFVVRHAILRVHVHHMG